MTEVDFDTLICEVRIEHVNGKISLHLPYATDDLDSVYLPEDDEKNILAIVNKHINIEYDPETGYDISLKEKVKSDE